MKLSLRSMGTLMAAVAMIGALSASRPAQASSNGRRNTAIALGAGALYELLQHKTTNGLLLGAGAAYAYKRYNDARRDEKRRRSAYYRSYNTYGGSDYGYRTRYAPASYYRSSGYSRSSSRSYSRTPRYSRYGGSSVHRRTSTRRTSRTHRHTRHTRHCR